MANITPDMSASILAGSALAVSDVERISRANCPRRPIRQDGSKATPEVIRWIALQNPRHRLGKPPLGALAAADGY
jgi:hypothetical protein